MHPVTYEADYEEERNRLTTFFRLILAIPWLIVFIVYAIGSLFVTIAAWLALIFVARYPDALRRYNTGFLRFHVAWSPGSGSRPTNGRHLALATSPPTQCG
jgi:hypothetical protein